MNMRKTQLIFAGLFLLAAAVPAFAQEQIAEEKKMDKVEADLNKDAAEPEGQKNVVEKLKADFKVDDARIAGLVEKNLSYGGMAAALSLAQGLPGGITDANVQKVVALRQGPPVMGWGKVAKELGLKLGPAVSKAKKAADGARKKIKEEKVKKEKAMKREKAEKGGKAERPAKPVKMDRPGAGGKR